MLVVLLILAGCGGTRRLPHGEKLYTGAEIKLEYSDHLKRKQKESIKSVAKQAMRPKPNKKFLGMRPKLWMYNYGGEVPKNKFRKWIKKMGEAPVLMSQISPGTTAAIIDANLFNIGVFKSYTEYRRVEKKRTVKVIYTSHIHKPYIVETYTTALSDSNVAQLVRVEQEFSLVKPGDDYSLAVLMNERSRVDALLKNNGYFYFNPDNLIFKADTSETRHTVSIILTLKDSLPANALTVYRIRQVTLNQNYSLIESAADSARQSFVYNGNIFIGTEASMTIRPHVIMRSVYLKKYEIYTRNNHNVTLNRLMSMGNFKFVHVKFSEGDTLAPGFLDVTILMTPLPKHTFRAEIDVISKSNNNLGPRLNLSYLNRNAFKGAELLTTNLAGSFEAQLSGANKNSFSYSVNPQVELFFPSFLLPFRVKTKSMYIPKTRFLLSFNYLKKVHYFDMKTLQFIYGFKWKNDRVSEHELNPVNVSYTSITNKSAEFTALLESNPFLKKSYEEQFIAGGSYSYTFNEQVLTDKKMQYYFQLSTEIAGNAFSLVNLIAGKKPTAATPQKVLGSIYSQYAKVYVDGRGYYNFSSKNKLAMRVFAGVATPYGNSSTLPYTKQFFSGGPNSLRAFHINSVGPGNYEQNADNTGFLQLGGDVKIELNAEYRFGIYSFFKGAFFVDVGNIWLLKSNPANTGSPFSFSGIYKELAVGTGFGLRVDVSFFILRFDLAMPIRKPWLEDNHRWVFNQIMLGNKGWRKENLILNVAIGYPF